MARNPLEVLEQVVTPQLLKGSDTTGSKATMLGHFYPILLSMLAAKPNVLGQLTQAGHNAFAHLIGNDTAHNDLISHLARNTNVPENEVRQLTTEAVPASLAALNQEAGSQGLATYLNAHRQAFTARLPAWATGLMTTLGVTAAAAPVVEHKTRVTTHTEPLVAVTAEQPSLLKKLLPLLGLILLGLLSLFFWKQCQKQPEPVATTPAPVVAPAPVAQKIMPALALTTGTGNQVFACNGTAGDVGLKGRINALLGKVFGGYDKCHIVADQVYATDLKGEPQLEQALNLVKAVPYASMELVGDKMTVNAPDEGKLKALVDQLGPIMKAAGVTVLAAAPLNAEQEVAQSIKSSQEALAGLSDPIRPYDIARALNLEIINFAVDSDVIPEVNKPVLDQAATLMKKVPNLELKIQGHTDSTGNEQHNKELSVKRAKSILAYLASKGVDTSKIVTEGFGSSMPRADNETTLGKFRNRRIEFDVVNTDNGAVTHVDGVQPVVTTTPAADATATPAPVADTTSTTTTSSTTTTTTPAVDVAATPAAAPTTDTIATSAPAAAGTDTAAAPK